MQTIRIWWRTTFGKIFIILAGGFSSAVFCCIGLLVLVAVVNPPAPAARSVAAARTAVLQQVADTTGDAARAPLPTIVPSAVSTAPPASATPQPTNTAQPTATPTVAPPSATPTVAPPSATPVPQVQITQAVNMRAGPSSAFAVKETVQPGTSATLLSVRNEDGTAWYQVRANSNTGWMSGTVVDVAPEQAAALPVNTARFVPPTAVPVRQPAAQPAAPAPSGGRVGAICRDGSRSSATGRGACSHHGGVAQWLYR